MRARRDWLAIAAPSFNGQSETFIHDHVRTIAPGETILLCKDGRAADRFGAPVLADIDPWHAPRTLGERAVNAVRHRWRKHLAPGLPRSARRRVAEFLDGHGPRALLAEYGVIGTLLAPACREAGVPLYVHFHGYDASVLVREPGVMRAYRRLFRDARGIITASQFMADKLTRLGAPVEKIAVCPYGIDTALFAPTRRLAQRVLAVGRLVEKKSPDKTIRAFLMIAEQFPDAHLDVIGDGPLGSRCRDLIAAAGVESRITLHGAREPEFVAKKMREASLFVQHSVTAANGDTEGLGVSILEAMACAVPVVATRHNGFVESVAHGATGLLVAEHDIDGMAGAMAALLADPDRAAAMGTAGRRRVLERFTHDAARDRLRAALGLAPYSATAERAA